MSRGFLMPENTLKHSPASLMFCFVISAARLRHARTLLSQELSPHDQSENR
jgi:hypothetical protein